MNLNKKCLFRILLFAGLILNSFDSNAQLNGTYTIGGTSPDYISFNSAVSALSTNGVSGPVIFNIRDGVYYEQVYIGVIAGASSINTIIFQSETGDSTNVTLQYASLSSANNYVVMYNGCDYLTFKKITVQSMDATYSIVFSLGAGSLNCGINHCIIRGVNTTWIGIDRVVIKCTEGSVNNMLINENSISGGYGGIHFEGISTGVQITGNTIKNQYGNGMDFSDLSDLTISRNILTTTSTLNNYTGIRVNSCGTGLVIAKNKINIKNGIYGLYISSCVATSGARGMVSNNFISASATGANMYGIYNYNSSYINYYYNSVNITRPGTAFPFYCTGSSSGNIQVLNNIFSNTGGGMAISSVNSPSITVCDYNDLYSTGTLLGNWAGTDCSTLSVWQTTSGKDALSVSVTPGFVSLTDLHLCNTLLNNVALPIAGVVDDIDGQTRNAVTPDIGADEFSTTLIVDLGPNIVTCTNVILNAGNTGSSYLWSTGVTTQTITTSTPGSYWVRVTNPCGTASDTVVVSNIPPVPGAISGPVSVCSNQIGNAYSVSAVSGATTYTWTVPADWSISSGSGTTSVTVTAGVTSGNICVTAGSGCASSSASCKAITNIGDVSAPGTITGNTSVCSGETGINYSISPVSGATSYTWTVPSGWTINSGQGTTIINVVVGSIPGDICVAAINSCFSSSQVCNFVSILNIPFAPASISGPLSVCSGSADQQYSVLPVSGATEYTWTIPSGWLLTSGQGNNTITVNVGNTSGNLSVVASNICGSSNATSNMIVVNPEPVQPVITQIVDTLFSSAISGNQWYIDDVLIAGATGQYYHPSQTGWYTVVFTDSNGCSSTSNPTYFTYTNVNLNQVSTSIAMYPNPGNGTLYFTSSGSITNNVVIEIYDLLGKKQSVHTLQIGSDPVSIETNLIPGLYNINILVGDNNVRKKLIIRH